MARLNRAKQRAMILALTLIVVVLMTTITLMMLEKSLLSMRLLSTIAMQ